MGRLINKYVSIGGIDRIVEISGAETITDKTLTSPVLDNALLSTPREYWAVNTNAGGSLTSITTSINLNPKTEGKSAWVFTGNTSATWTVNIGHASDNANANSLKNYLETGQSITISLAVYISNVAARATALTIDGAATTVYWQGGIAPAANSGSLDAFDVYTYTIIKTATTPTYVVFASKTEFDN